MSRIIFLPDNFRLLIIERLENNVWSGRVAKVVGQALHNSNFYVSLGFRKIFECQTKLYAEPFWERSVLYHDNNCINGNKTIAIWANLKQKSKHKSLKISPSLSRTRKYFITIFLFEKSWNFLPDNKKQTREFRKTYSSPVDTLLYLLLLLMECQQTPILIFFLNYSLACTSNFKNILPDFLSQISTKHWETVPYEQWLTVATWVLGLFHLLRPSMCPLSACGFIV